MANRRLLLEGACGLACALPPFTSHGASPEDADTAPAPPLSELIRHPLLAQTLYRHAVSRDYSPDGAAGSNRAGYRWIEEQRQGAEWVVRGTAAGRADWVALGWHELDWGLARQAADGGFGGGDAFHSASFFVEALARACLIDPASATPPRRDGLARAADWLHSPAAERRGVPANAPYTHRRYLLAAALGQAATVTGDTALARRAQRWAEEGLGLQDAAGTNPERGGFDAGYQMVGVLMALRYLPHCEPPALRGQLRRMIRRAVAPELARLRSDGSIDPSGSTRIESERARSGKPKDVPYGEIVQALVFAAQALPEPDWLAPARQIAVARGWAS